MQHEEDTTAAQHTFQFVALSTKKQEKKAGQALDT